MDGFKKIIKMKTGGSVAKAVAAYEKKEERAESKMHEDEKQDKKLIKKAIGMHDDQKHEGKTDLSALKKGGRCKREGGTVRKYKCGGNVKKMADGSLTGPLAAANQAVGVPATTAQNVAAADLVKRKLLAQQAAKARGAMPPAMDGAAGAAPMGGMGQAPLSPTPQKIGATTGPIMKKGGKVKKGCK